MTPSSPRSLLVATRVTLGILAGGAVGVIGAVATATAQEAPVITAPVDAPGVTGSSTPPTTRSKAVPTTPFVASPTLKAPPYGKS